MNSPLTSDELEALCRLDACTLANAIETFHKRLRNEGFIDHTIHCLLPRLRPMLGYAATLKIRGSAPPTTDGAYADRTDWWDQVVALPEPRVVVIEDASAKPGLGSLIGAVHMNVLRALHCVGVVTNGSVRDIPDAEEAGFHFLPQAWRSHMHTCTSSSLANLSRSAGSRFSPEICSMATCTECNPSLWTLLLEFRRSPQR